MSDRFPWFPFYSLDWRTSLAVRAMTYEQRGVFLELLAIAWDDGRERPSLPGDHATLAKLTELGKRWAKVGAPILAANFTLEEGRYYNLKLTAVWEVQRAKYELRAMAGREGGKAKAKAKQTASNAVANGKHTDADTDRTKSSSGATRLGALTDGAIASLVGRRPA